MTVRHLMTAAAFSASILASGVGFAADNTALATPIGIDAQLSEAQHALNVLNSGTVGREEKLAAEQNLQIARDLARQGQTARAQGYLNIARGTVGLSTGAGATEVAGSLEAAFSAMPQTVDVPDYGLPSHLERHTH